MTAPREPCPTCGARSRDRFDHAKARRLRAKGWSYRKIAEACGVTVGAVYWAVNERPKQ